MTDNWLVLYDSTDLRASEWHAYQKHSKKLEKSNQCLRMFETEEMPNYQSWLESHFAPTLTLVHQTVIQIKQTEDFLDQVHLYGALSGLSEASSFRILNEAKSNGTLHEIWQDLHEKQSQKKENGPCFKDLEDRFDSVFGDIFDDESAEDCDQDYGQSSDFSNRSGSRAGPKNRNLEMPTQALKSIYRKLALKLHPDYNANTSEEHKSLFQTVQSLYRSQNTEGLEAIWAKLLCGSEQVFNWKTAAIADIINRRRSVEKRLRSVAVGLRSAKVHPAWGFNKKNKSKVLLDQLKHSTKCQIENDLRCATHHLGFIKSQLQRLENKSQKKVSKKQRGK